MKKALINFKAEPADRDKWRDALEKEGKGRTLSDICRKSLDRFAKRVAEKGDAA